MTTVQIERNIKTILAAFEEHGQEAYFGEPVSQLEHAVQTAELAQKIYPADVEFILAAFLHDYGHLCGAASGQEQMDGYGTRHHERVGADALLKLGFSTKIARLVAGHVQAKRYLVTTDPVYFLGLSEASRTTLEKQGGLMSPDEQLEFEQDALFAQHLALRRLDEQAKVEGMPLPGLDWLMDRMREHVAQQQPA
ncbi:MAG: HD domain-containing protein [Saprospiraceae bacterium]|nr:HD domain-containing protein [Saprospiraceae bacterium]